MLNNFLIILVVRENIKIKLTLTIPDCAPTTLAGEMILTPPLVALKTACLCLAYLVYVIKSGNIFT